MGLARMISEPLPNGAAPDDSSPHPETTCASPAEPSAAPAEAAAPGAASGPAPDVAAPAEPAQAGAVSTQASDAVASAEEAASDEPDEPPLADGLPSVALAEEGASAEAARSGPAPGGADGERRLRGPLGRRRRGRGERPARDVVPAEPREAESSALLADGENLSV